MKVAAKRFFILFAFSVSSIGISLWLIHIERKVNGAPVFDFYNGLLLTEIRTQHPDPFLNPPVAEGINWRWKKARDVKVGRKLLDSLEDMLNSETFVPREPKHALTISNQKCVLISDAGPTVQVWIYRKDGENYILDEMLKTAENSVLWKELISLVNNVPIQGQ